MICAAKLPATVDMSALSALLAIRSYASVHAGAPLEEIVEALGRSDSDLSAVNFAGGVALHVALDSDLPLAPPTAFFRRVLHAWVADQLPWWLRLFPSGRERVLTALSVDEVQCFRASGLLQDPPSPEVWRWWDYFANLRRSQEDDALTQQGREAERWSMDHEASRLTYLGIPLNPKWMAIESNRAGYDILSFNLGEVEPVAKLIEVKSSTQTPPRIVITRNEWEKAVEYGETYFFHVWTVPGKKLTELRSADIGPHIPTDRGTGHWSEVVIPIE